MLSRSSCGSRGQPAARSWEGYDPWLRSGIAAAYGALRFCNDKEEVGVPEETARSLTALHWFADECIARPNSCLAVGFRERPAAHA